MDITLLLFPSLTPFFQSSAVVVNFAFMYDAIILHFSNYPPSPLYLVLNPIFVLLEEEILSLVFLAALLSSQSCIVCASIKVPLRERQYIASSLFHLPQHPI